MAVKDYSTTASSNTSISGINIAEGWLAGDANAAFRQLMADIRTRFLEQAYSVKDYGAVGNGSTNDTTAIQNCVTAAAAAGVPVLFPPGTYQISGDGIELASNSVLIGAGIGRTIIRKTSDTNAYCVYASAKSGIRVFGMTFDGSRSQTVSYTNSKFGLYFTNCSDVRVAEVEAKQSVSNGIVLEYCKNARLEEIRCNDNNKDGLYLSGCDGVHGSGVEARRNGTTNGIGIAIAATWDFSIRDFVCTDNTEAEMALSRDTRYGAVSDGVLGDRYNGAAPISLYILGEELASQTLHLNVDGTGGETYGASAYYGCERVLFSNIKCRKGASLELAEACNFIGVTFEDSASHAVTLYGSSANAFDNCVFRDYADRGVSLLNSPKNGTVSNSDNSANNCNWIQTAGSLGNRIADFAGVGGFRETGSTFNGANALMGSATYDPPSLATGAVGATTTVNVTGAALGDVVEGVSFSLDTQGVQFDAWVSAANTVTVLPRNPTAGTIDLASGTIRVWIKKK